MLYNFDKSRGPWITPQGLVSNNAVVTCTLSKSSGDHEVRIEVIFEHCFRRGTSFDGVALQAICRDANQMLMLAFGNEWDVVAGPYHAIVLHFL